MWGMTISKSLNRYLQRGKVKCARNTKITICVTLAVTLALEQVPKVHEVAHGPTINLDAGKTLCWAGATPLLHTVPWPKRCLGSLQPRRISFGARDENLDEAGEEGRNYVLQLRLHHLLLLVNLISLGKTRK
jgi:hypothetical protein